MSTVEEYRYMPIVEDYMYSGGLFVYESGDYMTSG